MTTALQKFKNIRDEIRNYLGDANVYLYGSSLRDVLLNRVPSKFSLFIESKNIPDALAHRLSRYKKFEFKNGKRITFDDCNYTIDCVYTHIDDIISNNENIHNSQNALRDMKKGVLRFSKSAKSNISSNPFLMLEIVLLVDELGFYMDSNTINFIFNNRKELKNIEKRKVFNFLKDVIKAKKPRKVVSNLNTLSISSELFGFQMFESSVLNHLRETDFYEFITIVFSNVDLKEIDSFLIDKCGFLFRDTHPVVKIAEAIDGIQGEDSISARKFLATIDKKRIANACRLLKALDFKDLSKQIKREKNAVVSSNDLCISEETLTDAFGITDQEEIKQMLDKAISKIINEPEYNEQGKLLVYLNRERSSSWQEEENLK